MLKDRLYQTSRIYFFSKDFVSLIGCSVSFTRHFYNLSPWKWSDSSLIMYLLCFVCVFIEVKAFCDLSAFVLSGSLQGRRTEVWDRWTNVCYHPGQPQCRTPEERFGSDKDWSCWPIRSMFWCNNKGILNLCLSVWCIHENVWIWNGGKHPERNIWKSERSASSCW